MSDHYSTDGPICPYCGYITHPDEGFYYDEATTDLQCPACGEDFVVSIFVQTSWTTKAKEAGHE